MNNKFLKSYAQDNLSKLEVEYKLLEAELTELRSTLKRSFQTPNEVQSRQNFRVGREKVEFVQNPMRFFEQVIEIADGSSRELKIFPLSPRYNINEEIEHLYELGLFSNITSISFLDVLIGKNILEKIATAKITLLSIHSAQKIILPGELWQFTNLTSLDLSNNYLDTLPAEIGQLTNLTSLDLSNNKLTILPIELWELINLAELNLYQNQLATLPHGIGQLRFLTALNVGNNQLVRIPSEIGRLTKLESLNLSNHEGELIADSDITFNQIASLPTSLQNLKSLIRLDLRDNPLPIPPEILKKINEPQAILNYYFSHKKKPLNEVKVIFVGQGSVGKTSLVRQLLHSKFNVNEIKTDGISINRWQIKNHSKDREQAPKISLNVWDFGGQEIMHATHQFFLTKRSLYILVLDARLTQEENRVEYWLKIIQSFSDESPVLIVGNKTDQHPLDVDRSGLQKKYPNIVGVFETSAATGAGIEELKYTITDQVNNLPHVHDLLPESWFNVKAQLEKLGQEQNFITHDDYISVWCTENDISEESSQRTLIGFLHDLGVVIYFQDDPRLEGLGILNPQWVTNGVYKILNAHALFQNKGELTVPMLNDILNIPEYPRDKQLFIVDMMKKFELCYDIEADKKFLVPDLLPKDEPFTGEWQGALTFQYHYNVLPSSIITRFIVRMNGFVYKTVWRSGVILKKDGNMALVKADTEERKIYIWVNGDEPTRRDFLSVIRAEFDAIHKTIIKIEAIQKVPHPEYPDLVLDYAELLQFERDNIAEFPRSVDGKTIMVNVHQLLNGVRVGSESAPVVKNVPPPAVAPVKVNTASAKPAIGNQSLLVRILSAVFVSLPRVIGRFALDIFGRGKDSADSTFVLLGYVLIVLSALAVWGIVDVNSLRDWFTGWWRFFFPVKP